MSEEQVLNGYEDDDLSSIVTDIEELEAEKKAVMAAALQECGQITKRIKNKFAEAKDDLAIPLKPLKAMLKLRKKQREMDAIVADVPEEFGEMLESMQAALGDFADTPLGEAAVGAVKRRHGLDPDADDAEQDEGEEVLSRRKKH